MIDDVEVYYKNITIHSLTSVAQWVGRCSTKCKAAGSITGQGTCLGGRFALPVGVCPRGNQWMFLSLSSSLPLSLEVNK